VCQASSHSSASRPSSPISSRTCAGRAGAAARHAATTVAIPGGAAGPPERFVETKLECQAMMTSRLAMSVRRFASWKRHTAGTAAALGGAVAGDEHTSWCKGSVDVAMCALTLRTWKVSPLRVGQQSSMSCGRASPAAITLRVPCAAMAA